MNNEKPGNMKTNILLLRAMWAVDEHGDYKKALDLYQKIVASGHRLSEAYCGIGVCQKMLGNQEAAIAAAKEALQIRQDHYKALQLLASLYHSQGNVELTYEYVSRALKCKPITMTETYPRLTAFARKVLSGQADFQVEDTVEFDYLDATWIVWAEEFKAEYEAKHPSQMHENNELA